VGFTQKQPVHRKTGFDGRAWHSTSVLNLHCADFKFDPSILYLPQVPLKRVLHPGFFIHLGYLAGC